ncbi:hypothetical protein CHUAL_005072 [Chamberlinius hualienensis]
MPYCASPDCNNSTNKGYRLFAFPRDPIKREKWRQNCGRGDDWKPSKNHKICELHFDDNQYETRALTCNGNRKLKPCAVPTLFQKSPHSTAVDMPSKKTLKKKELSSKRNQKSETTIILDKPRNSNKTDINLETNNLDDLTSESTAINTENTHSDIHHSESINAISAEIRRCADASTSTQDLEEIYLENNKSIYEIKMEKLLNKVVSQCTTIRQLKRKLLKTQRQLNVQFDCVNKIFTPDQLKALRYTTKGRFEWSDETIRRSVHLRLACGPKGYNYLVSTGYPFPSYRTLCSRAEPPKQPQLLEYHIENVDASEL